MIGARGIQQDEDDVRACERRASSEAQRASVAPSASAPARRHGMRRLGMRPHVDVKLRRSAVRQ
jgi:hypothetical protein